MLQESNSDLLGHRKRFLSAGVTSGVRPSLPQTSERMLSEARRGCTGHTLAEVGGRTRSQSSPARQTLKNKTEQNWSVYLDGTSSLSLIGTGERTVRNRSEANRVAWFSHQWHQHLNWCSGLAYVSITAWYLEFVDLKRSKYSSLLPLIAPKKSSYNGMLEWAGTSMASSIFKSDRRPFFSVSLTWKPTLPSRCR